MKIWQIDYYSCRAKSDNTYLFFLDIAIFDIILVATAMVTDKRIWTWLPLHVHAYNIQDATVDSHL